MEIGFAFFVITRWIHAATWAIPQVWYRYSGLVIITALPILWSGVFLGLRVLVDRRSVVTGRSTLAKEKSPELPLNRKLLFIGLASITLVGAGTAILSFPRGPLQDRFVAIQLMTAMTIWTFNTARLSRGDVRQFWAIFVLLGLGLLAMCLYLYPPLYCLGSMSLGTIGGLFMVKFGRKAPRVSAPERS
jgi:hypothetical protein